MRQINSFLKSALSKIVPFSLGVSCIAAFSVVSFATAAAASEAGAKKFRDYNCTACHGPQGKFPILAQYPKLAGLSKEYVVQQLSDFRAGNRAHSNSKIMGPIAKSLAPADYEVLGEYLASVPAADPTKTSSTAVSKGAEAYTARNCHTCHGEAGRAPIVPYYPRLAGQSSKYLAQQIRAIKSGERANGMSAVMKAMIVELPDAEIDLIAEWLQNQ